jgi:hypothetical protein
VTFEASDILDDCPAGGLDGYATAVSAKGLEHSMKTASLIAVAAFCVVSPNWLSAGLIPNRYEIRPLQDGVFEVVSLTRSGASDYWCGAGDYARNQLRAPVTQRIYIWKAIGPSVGRSGRKAVQFSFTAPEGANTTPGYSLSVKAVGDNMTVDAAYQYCFNYDLTDF